MQNNPIMVRDLPENERPREKLLKYGTQVLSNLELLAVLLCSGTKKQSVLHVAEGLLAKDCEAGIAGLADLSAVQLSQTHGIGPAKSCLLLAAIELGRRIEQNIVEQRKLAVKSPQQAADYLAPHLRYAKQEKFAIILLDTKNQITSFKIISVGTLNASLVHPREVFHAALQKLACSIILAHNHPSGDPRPSQEDILLTKRLRKAGEVLGIPVLDHVIIGGTDYFSFKEEGLME